MAYMREIEDALAGRYYEPGDHPSKLRMLILNQADVFNDEMHENGETLKFKRSIEDLDQEKSLKRDIYHEIQELSRMSRGTELPGEFVPPALPLFKLYYWTMLRRTRLSKSSGATKPLFLSEYVMERYYGKASGGCSITPSGMQQRCF